MNTHTLGRFITVEGTEGVGKSTNLRYLCDLLAEQGIEVVLTREPGGTPLAEELRALLLEPRDEHISQDTELLLMFAARAQHICNVIRPALARGAWVISDRFTDATFAYQGGGRQISDDLIMPIRNAVLKGFEPDLTLLMDLDPRVGLQRAAARGELDRIEKEQIEFFDRTREAYLGYADKSDKIEVINAELSLEQVQSQITQALESWLSKQN